MSGRPLPIGPTGRRVAANIAAARRERGLTLTDLAADLDNLGRRIPEQSLSHIEQGRRRVDMDDLVVLAVALDVSVGALFGATITEREDA